MMMNSPMSDERATIKTNYVKNKKGKEWERKVLRQGIRAIAMGEIETVEIEAQEIEAMGAGKVRDGKWG